MGIFDKIIGKQPEKVEEKKSSSKNLKKKTENSEKPKTSSTKKESDPKQKKVEKKVAKVKKVAKRDENFAYEIIHEPLITEKSTNLGQLNKYVFKVGSKAKKGAIRQAVEDYYGVGVMAVHTIKIHPKKRIQGRTIGYKKGYKKAIVTLQAGDSIGLAEGV